MKQKWIAGRTALDIAGSVERGIHEGRVGRGDPLPTVRTLAQALKVSPVTVAAAYKLLRGRGLIAGERRQGTRVTAPPAEVWSAPSLAAAAGGIDLASGNPDPGLLPTLEPALRAIDPSPRLYGGTQDLNALVTFARGEFEADGVAADAIAVCSGALDGIERVLREYLRPGDGVAVEDPSFPGIHDLIAASGWSLVPFAIDAEGPVPEAFEHALRRRCRAVIVSSRAQNPTGAAITVTRADILREILERFPDVLLIEHDDAGPVAGVPLITLRATREPAVFVRSTSKFLGPDLRVAVMAGDRTTIARLQGRQALGARWVSHLLQQLALALWSDPANGRRIARATDVYSRRRVALTSALASRGIAVQAVSGFHVWLPVRDESTVLAGLMERGWDVAAGERFRIRTPPGIRITCSTLEPDQAARLAADLTSALGQRRDFA